MTAAKSVLSIGELEAGFPSYCLALRTLRPKKDQRSIERTRCWDYLQRLHASLPRSTDRPQTSWLAINAQSRPKEQNEALAALIA